MKILFCQCDRSGIGIYSGIVDRRALNSSNIVYPREAAMRKKVFVRSTRFLLPHVFAHRSCNISRDSEYYWFLFLCFFLYQQTTTPNLTLILPIFQAIFKPFHPQIRIVLALDEVEYIPHNHIHSRKK